MTGGRIMIVEDERITAEHLHDILVHLGYDVTAVASTGADALRYAETTQPELVMMDIRIRGDLDGTETAQLLRERFDIPVVYLTAHADRETLNRARLAEPLGYLVKPFQEHEVEASIEMALHKQRADRTKRQQREQLAAALGAVREAVVSVDREGAVLFLNETAEAWTGRKLSQGLNRHEVLQLLHARTRASADGPIHRALEQGTLCELDDETVLIGAGGAERAVSGSVTPVRGPSGGVSGVVVILTEADKDPAAPSRQPGSGGSASGQTGGFEMVAESPSMRQVTRFARRVAQSEVSTILLEGESGTGKDVIAKFLHYHSPRRSEAFLAINCAAIPETLLESELFGYEKGAFTDARAQKKGILEMATGGYVFLDEIAEMPLALQAKLLRVIEDQCFRRLGGVKDTQVNLRVIAATNRDLGEAVSERRFRLDLYYRLNVIQIHVPALRERREDIVPLANFFLRSFNARFHRNIRGVSPAGIDELLAHDWPGNVRELRNTIERAMVLEETDWVQPSSLGIRHEHVAIPTAVAAPTHAGHSSILNTEGMSLEEAEKGMLLRALEKTGWNQTRAAKVLEITRDTLRYKMKKFNLRPPQPPGD